MSDRVLDVLTEPERAALADGLPPHRLHYDTPDPPACDHCSRRARYSLVLGEFEDRLGRCAKPVCDRCLERYYDALELPVVARLFGADAEG